MSRDFFLLNRSYQVAKLCSSQPSSVITRPATGQPSSKSRAALPEKQKEFLGLIDRICTLASHDSETGAEPMEAELQAAQRRDLEDFEKLVVVNRFSSDPAVKQPAVNLIRAIFADAEYYSGLKPLPQYTEAFAYELLFPSWLNLLTATMLPRSSDGKPRLEGKRQGVLFQYLGKISARGAREEHELVGFMTFVASRFDAPYCEELLQRIVELHSRHGVQLTDALAKIDASCRDARVLKERLHDYLTVQYSLLDLQEVREFEISAAKPAKRPVPDSLARQLEQLEQAEDWDTYFAIAHPLRHLFNSENFLVPELAQAIAQHPARAAELFSLVVQSDGPGKSRILSSEGQTCLAKLLLLDATLDAPALSKIQGFARDMAHRLQGYNEAKLEFFIRTMLDDPQNRAALLSSCATDQQREQLAANLLERAGKTEDNSKFLNLLGCAIAVSPRADVLEAKHALLAIDAVVSNRSIGNKELSDLVQDLQSNHARAIEYLASPIMAAAGKSPRMAALYMTLNEASEKLASTGNVENFSVLRAKYSALTNLQFD